MQEVKIQKRNGFDLKIGDYATIFFATSQENLQRVASLENTLDSFVAGIKAKYEARLNELVEILKEGYDSNVFEEKIEIEKTIGREVYDLIFGAGTFDRLYASVNEIEFWLENLEPIFSSLEAGIDHDFKQREKKAKEKRNDFLKKKARKR